MESTPVSRWRPGLALLLCFLPRTGWTEDTNPPQPSLPHPVEPCHWTWGRCPRLSLWLSGNSSSPLPKILSCFEAQAIRPAATSQVGVIHPPRSFSNFDVPTNH